MAGKAAFKRAIYVSSPLLMFFALLVLILAKALYLLASAIAFGLVLLALGFLEVFKDQEYVSFYRLEDVNFPSYTTMPGYAISALFLSTIIGIGFISSRRKIVKNLKPITTGDMRQRGVMLVAKALQEILPKSEAARNIIFYHDFSQKGMVGFRDLFARVIVIGRAPVKWLTSAPQHFMFCYYHEVHHIKAGDSLLVNTFSGWLLFIYFAALFANSFEHFLFRNLLHRYTERRFWGATQT